MTLSETLRAENDERIARERADENAKRDDVARSVEKHRQRMVGYERAFDGYLRRGVVAPELRDLGVGTGSAGGFLVPSGFLDKLTVGLKRGSAMVRSVNVVPTASGQSLTWPTADDTGNVGAIQGEGTAPTTQDVTFGSKALGAFMYTSKQVRASRQLLQDSGIDLDGWLGLLLGRRIGRAVNTHLTVGTGGGTQPTGLMGSVVTGVTLPTGNTTTFTYDGVVDLIGSVDAEYVEPMDEPDPVPGFVGFMGSATALKALRKVKDSSNAPIVTEGSPVRVLGWEFRTNNDIAVPAANAKSLVFGAFGPGYVARQVTGDTTVLRLDERGADALQVYFLGAQRWDGVPDDPAALRCLQHSAT